jgi:phage recombination protein Bet
MSTDGYPQDQTFDGEYAADDNPNRNRPMNTSIANIPKNEIMVPSDKIQLLKDTICKGATDDELSLFVEVCNRRKLDPFAKQIYAIKRNVKDGNDWKSVMGFQTSIDGFRAIAERTGELDGQEGPFWCDGSGAWSDVWLGKAPPVAAKVIVFRKGRSRGWTGTARFDSYAQKDRQGNLTKFWRDMPDLMIAKVAEALALRKAFPEDLSGLYTMEEMDQAGNGEFPRNGNGHAKGQGQPTTPDEVLKSLQAEGMVDPDQTIDADEDINEENFIRACGDRDFSREAAQKVLSRIRKNGEFTTMWTDNPRRAFAHIVEKAKGGFYDAYLAEAQPVAA